MRRLFREVWLSPERFTWLSQAARRVPLQGGPGRFAHPHFEYCKTLYWMEQH